MSLQVRDDIILKIETEKERELKYNKKKEKLAFLCNIQEFDCGAVEIMSLVFFLTSVSLYFCPFFNLSLLVNLSIRPVILIPVILNSRA